VAWLGPGIGYQYGSRYPHRAGKGVKPFRERESSAGRDAEPGTGFFVFGATGQSFQAGSSGLSCGRMVVGFDRQDRWLPALHLDVYGSN
jgi:hypothetical protein